MRHLCLARARLRRIVSRRLRARPTLDDMEIAGLEAISSGLPSEGRRPTLAEMAERLKQA